MSDEWERKANIEIPTKVYNMAIQAEKATLPGPEVRIMTPMNIVSFSEVSKFDQCKKQYEYSFIRGYRPEDTSAAITEGTFGHKMLQYFYEALKGGATIEEAIRATEQRVGEFLKGIHFTQTASFLVSWTVVNAYIRSVSLPKVALVENRFLLPATLISADPAVADVHIGFTPDVVFERNGFYDVEDSKFVGRGWAEKKLNRFPQAKLYQIFLELMGYNMSRSSVRFFNTKTGEVKLDNAVFERGEREVLKKDFTEAIKEVIAARGNPETYYRRTMNFSTCQYCFYETPCTISAKGRNDQNTLNAMFVKSDYNYTG